MRLSETTLDVIKNYSKIWSEMVFRPGNFQATMTEGGDFFACTRIQEAIPRAFDIYDINELLGILSMFKGDMDIDFTDTTLVITGKGGKSKVSYRLTSPNLIKLKLPTEEIVQTKLGNLQQKVTFNLTDTDLKWITKTAKILKSSHIKIDFTNEVVITNLDLEDSSMPTQSLTLESVNGSPMSAAYEADRFDLVMDDNYVCHVAPNGFLTLKGQQKGITYYIAPVKNTVK